MDNQEYKRQRQQLLEEEKRLYEAEPEVYGWVKTKEMIFKCIAGYWIVHAILAIITVVQIQSDANAGMEIVKLLFQIFWIYVIISPKGTWRLNAVFYFLALANLGLNMTTYFENLQGHLGEMFIQMPVMGVIFVMEMLVPFLFLAAACYLTLPKKHRILSERAEEIHKNFVEEFKLMNKK